MAGGLIVDDALIEECQAEQQANLGYSYTRDEVARKIVALITEHPELTRERIVWHIGGMGTPRSS
jgi:hypothetical protein